MYILEKLSGFQVISETNLILLVISTTIHIFFIINA